MMAKQLAPYINLVKDRHGHNTSQKIIKHTNLESTHYFTWGELLVFMLFRQSH